MELKTYQQAVLDKLNQGGFKQDEMAIFSSGRQTGKSQINQYINQWYSMQADREPLHKIINSAEVDGKTWHTIACRKEVSMWIRENGVENDSWYEHINDKWTVHRNMFDVSADLYMMVVLKFGR